GCPPALLHPSRGEGGRWPMRARRGVVGILAGLLAVTAPLAVSAPAGAQPEATERSYRVEGVTGRAARSAVAATGAGSSWRSGGRGWGRAPRPGGRGSG